MTHSEPKLKRQAGLIGLLFAGVGGMIGSGWLFGPLETAMQAGPMSIWSWIIGGVIVMLIALVFAELATLFPLSGAIVHMSHVSHGARLGFIWSWILILAYVAIAPIETMAIVTYADAYIPGLTDSKTGVLTLNGLILASAILGLMVALNFFMIRTVLGMNTWATWWKILIPIATVIVLLSYSWHPENLNIAAPHTGFEGIFTAIATGGVFFSLFGFRQAIDLAGESTNPGRNLPIAIIGTVLIGTLIYVALQFAFLIAIPPTMIAKGGWAGLQLSGLVGPLASLATIIGASWWASILYADAVISPGACGFVFTTTTSRIVMASAQTQTLPAWFARVSVNGVPWASLIATYLVGLVFFFPFPSWQKMVGYISAITVLSYGIGPILLLRLRKALPDAHRPFRLWGANVIAPIAFISSNWIIIWSGTTTINFLFQVIALIVLIHGMYHFIFSRQSLARYEWQGVAWLVPYFGGIWLISLFSAHELGGNGSLSFISTMLISLVFSLLVFVLALKTSRTDAQIKASFEAMLKHDPA
jgi:amino acid transporter